MKHYKLKISCLNPDTDTEYKQHTIQVLGTEILAMKITNNNETMLLLSAPVLKFLGNPKYVYCLSCEPVVLSKLPIDIPKKRKATK